jgi:hypothetical protein
MRNADNSRVTRFVKQTWLPTLLFALLSRPGASPSCGIPRYIGPTMAALVLVPLDWRWSVMSSGRPHVRHAVLAGASIGFMIEILPPTILAALANAQSGLSDGLADGFANLALLIRAGIALGIAAPVGAIVGALVAWTQAEGCRQTGPQQLTTCTTSPLWER